TTDNLYLLAILNSKIGDYYLKQIGVSRSGGYMEYKPMFIEQLPIPIISIEKQRPFIKMVETILSNKNGGKDILSIEKKIDDMAFELYGLTNKEQLLILGLK